MIREEMTQAIRTTAAAVSHGILEPSDITEELLERCLYTAHSPSVDLLIRDSFECYHYTQCFEVVYRDGPMVL